MKTAYLLLLVLLVPAIDTAPTVDAQSSPSQNLPSASDDEVVGVSEIFSPYNYQIMVYSTTEIGADLTVSYTPAVSAYVNASEVNSTWTPVQSPNSPPNEVWNDQCVQPSCSNLTSNAAYVDDQDDPIYTVPNMIYTLVGIHYLAGCIEYDPYSGDGGESTYYANPENFEPITTPVQSFGDLGPGPSGAPLLSGGDTVELMTYVSVNTTPPNITAVYNHGTTTPASAVVGSSGMIDVIGNNLTAAGDDLTPLVADIAPGVTVQLAEGFEQTDGQLTLDYQISQTAGLGYDLIEVQTYAGYSCGGSQPSCTDANSSNSIQVGDATPVILSVSPNPVVLTLTPNPNEVVFTITGTGFGTNPTVTLAIGPVGYMAGCVGAPSISCDQTIVTTAIPIPASTPSTTALLTVQSNGYTASGFQPVQQGGGSKAAQPVPINGAQQPTPQILFNGTNVAGTTALNPVPVTVGQQIALTVTWSGGIIPQTESWMVNDSQGNPLSGVARKYNGFTQSNQLTVIPLPAPGPCQATTPCLTFYFVWAGTSGEQTQTVAYNYTLTGGQKGSATATFDVNGPILNGNSVTVAFGTAHVSPVWGLEFGDLSTGGTPGVTFTAPNPITLGPNAAPGPHAIYQYVQLVTGDTRTELPYNDSTHSATNPQVCTAATSGLDSGVYPSPFGPPYQPPLNIFIDSPTTPYPTTLGERLRDFSATLYLMWDPGLPAVGGANPRTPARTTVNAGPPPSFIQTPSNCSSIPVPLVSIGWEFKACFINTLNPTGGANLDGSQNGTPWSVSCGQPKSPQVTILQPNPNNNYAYPQWTSAFTAGQNTCH